MQHKKGTFQLICLIKELENIIKKKKTVSAFTEKAPFSHITETTENVVFLLMLLLVLMIKVFFIIYANPLPDEAYYWLWSKNIALSFFDHPPLATWEQSLLHNLSSNKYFIIRALPIVSLGTVLTIMIMWQKYIFKSFDYNICLKSVVLFLVFPIYNIFFSISFPDHLLITLLFASSFCLFLYFERNKKLKSGMHYWYLAVLFFSLAFLTKYNAVLFGIGVLAYFLYYKKQICGPSYGHIFASILIIFFIQMPVFLWNLSNDFASFSFHMIERLDQGKEFSNVLRNIAGFLSGVLLAFSPVFLFNLRNNFFLENVSDDRKNIITMSKFIIVFSLSFCIFLCFFTNILYYWLIPAMVPLIPFVTNVLKEKSWQYLHIFYGMAISLILVINVSVYPIGIFFGTVDRETAILFGWEKIVEVVDKEKKELGIEKVVFSDYRLGSLYIFHSHDFNADVVMEERRTQFDVWRGEENFFGKSTLIIADDDFPIGQRISSSFEKIEFVRDIEIRKGNKLVKKYQVFLGTNA